MSNDNMRSSCVRLDVCISRPARNSAYVTTDMATWPWVHVRWLHKIDIKEFPRVRKWYEKIADRPAVQRGVGLLKADEKIGNPDKVTRAAFFGRQQLQQGRR